MTSIRPNHLLKISFLAASTFAFMASSAWATLVTWDLNSSGANADVGSNSQSYTVSGYTITAYGYDNNSGTGTAHELHFKNDGSDEVGLGLAGISDYELQVDSHGTPLQFIQLSLGSILSQGFTNGKIEIGSVQSPDSFNLYGSNTLGSLGTKLNSTPYDSSNDDKFISVPDFGTYKFISIAEAVGDSLPVAFEASIVPVPEAASLVPLCLVIAVTIFEARRRRHPQA